MARRITPSQLQSMMRQAQQKQKQAIDKYNREVRSHNQKVKQAEQKQRQAISNYNRAVSAHNGRVRANHQRLKNELARLERKTSTSRHISFRVSVDAVHTAYERLELAAATGTLDGRYNEILDLSEQEAANNAGMMNALMDDSASYESDVSSTESPLTSLLSSIQPDFGMRWQGAIFSLNPQNPDAARHFCTSAREIISGILQTKAPDSSVFEELPDCECTQQGTPTRRAKIRYFLQRKGINKAELEDFIVADMDNVVSLFSEFNQGTHGPAGTFTFHQLQALRKRVEDGITFLARIVN